MVIGHLDSLNALQDCNSDCKFSQYLKVNTYLTDLDITRVLFKVIRILGVIYFILFIFNII